MFRFMFDEYLIGQRVYYEVASTVYVSSPGRNKNSFRRATITGSYFDNSLNMRVYHVVSPNGHKFRLSHKEIEGLA